MLKRTFLLGATAVALTLASASFSEAAALRDKQLLPNQMALP